MESEFPVTVTLIVCAAALITSVGYGLISTENVALMAARNDVTPLYFTVSLSRPFSSLSKCLLASFTSVSGGELSLTFVALSFLWRLERSVGALRYAMMIGACWVGRVLWLLMLLSHNGSGDGHHVHIRPSMLWLIASLHAVALRLIRGPPVLHFCGIPTDINAALHVTVLILVALRRCSFWDTVVPGYVVGWLMLTRLVNVAAWPATLPAPLRRLSSSVAAVSEIRKSFRVLPSPQQGLAAATTATAPPAVRPQAAARGADGRRGGTLAPPSLASLVEMGFGEADAAEALRATNGNVSHAAALLVLRG